MQIAHLLRNVLSNKQILILNTVNASKGVCISELVRKVKEREHIPDSTLKFNIYNLKELGLLEFNENGNEKEVRTTDLWLLAADVLNYEK